MYDNFNVQECLDKIKSSLFDIYENQEEIIGGILDDDKKNQHVEKYIETKDLAIKLIENIMNLYNENDIVSTQKNEINDEKIDDIKIEKEQDETELFNSNLVDSDEQQEINNVDEADESSIDLFSSDSDTTELQFNENEESKIDMNVDSEEEDSIVDMSSSDSNNTELQINDGNDEKKVINIEESDNTKNKFYLDSRNGSKPGFAYVPESIYKRIKENAYIGFSNKIYKKDGNKPKGIIVRTDQFMKLSFSKHRQEGVLKEAKAFRVEQAKKSRQKLQEEALANGKVEINI